MILKSNNQDSRFFSADIALAFRDPCPAIVIQQLHYWIQKRQGKVIDGVRYIHNTYEEWLSEQFKWFSTWQLRKIFGKLRELGIVKVKRHWAKTIWRQTNFYTLDYDRLVEFVKEKTGVTIEMTELCNTTNGDEGCPQNEVRTVHNSYTKTSSKGYNQRKNPPPTPSETEELEREEKKVISSIEDLQDRNPQKTSLQQSKSFSTAESSPKKSKPQRVTHYREKIRQSIPLEQGPWRSVEEFNLFYQALVTALPTVANARNADAVAKTIVKDICDGVPHSYWLDWKNGSAIGTTDKPEWQAAPGIPYPMFVEYLAEYLKADGDDTKKAKKKAYDYLAHPDRVRGLWREFKRDLEGVMARVEDAEKAGAIASVPTWFTLREEVTAEQAAETAAKIHFSVGTEDRLVRRHELAAREHSIFTSSGFDRLMLGLQRQLEEANKYGYEGQARKAIAHVSKNVKTIEDLARLKRIVQDLYPSQLNLVKSLELE